MSLLIHSRFNPPGKVKLECPPETRTQQHFKNEANINSIMRRYKTTGTLVDPLAPRRGNPMYGDFSQVSDFQSAQNALIEAENAFMSLPSEIRRRFQNNPAEFLKFLENPENREEAIKLGLIEKPEPMKAPKASADPEPAPSKEPAKASPDEGKKGSK